MHCSTKQPVLFDAPMDADLSHSSEIFDPQDSARNFEIVIISDSTIHFPKVIQPNVLVCLTQEAYNSYYPIIRPGGLLITDTRFVKTEKKVDARQIELSMYRRVIDEIGKPIVFNICTLGAVVRLTELVKPESIMKVLENRIPAGFLDMNRKALEIGLELGEAVAA